MKRGLILSFILLLVSPSSFAQVLGTYHHDYYVNDGVFVPVGPELLQMGAAAEVGTVTRALETLGPAEGVELRPFQETIFEIPAVLQCKSPTGQVVALSIVGSTSRTVAVPIFGTKRCAVQVIGSQAGSGALSSASCELRVQGTAMSSGRDFTGWGGSIVYKPLPLHYAALADISAPTKACISQGDEKETFIVKTEGMTWLNVVYDTISSGTTWVRITSADLYNPFR